MRPDMAVPLTEPEKMDSVQPADPPLPTMWNFDLGESPFDPDAACAVTVETAKTEFLPVDIIWVVDNSVSMAPAIDQVTAGLNQFAAIISGKTLDYKIIMLSLRSKTNPITFAGGTRYAVCIPPPLAGDDNCGNGPRFFQSSVDIRSWQPLEQFLGTLAQTRGYEEGKERGGQPWRDQLRASATKTIVVVTDDNSRFSSSDFETFKGGVNPFNQAYDLPPGILDPYWMDLFKGYTFDGLYGWGSTSDPDLTCKYSNNSTPPASGKVYSELVVKTTGVRAQICGGASSWGPFFDGVAQAVARTARLSCDLAIPTPSGGTLDPAKVNVSIEGASGSQPLFKVSGAGACGTGGGWYYDSDLAPARVILCPVSCDAAQTEVAAGSGTVRMHFGCSTIIL
jgi:hypothetical protein